MTDPPVAARSDGEERLVGAQLTGTRPRSGRPARPSARVATTPAGSGSPGPRRRPARSRRAAPRRRRARPGRGRRCAARGRARRRPRSSRRSRAAIRPARRSRRGARSRRPIVSKVASMPPVSSPGNVQLTSWLKNRLKPRPADPVLRPAAGRVRGPGHGPPEPVLPLGEERVVARRDEHALGGRLDRRPVVAAELGQARRRGRAGSATTRSGSGRTSPRRSAGRRPAASP